MEEFRTLMDQFWITRADNKDQFFAVKRAEPSFRKLLNENLGWNLVMTESMVKLEKVPPKAESWMGIEEFQEPLDYCLLCAVLLYLTDRDDGEHFLLSSLTEQVETICKDTCPVDWTKFTHRKALVRVLRYVQKLGMLIVFDGNSEGFSTDRNQEALYRNTGLCNHFLVHYGTDIMDLETVEDFENMYASREDTQRTRRQRVYQNLTLNPAVFWHQEDPADYDYIKKQHVTIGRNLELLFDGQLQVHRNGAFCVLPDGDRLGRVFPDGKGITDITLLMCAQLRNLVLKGDLERTQDDFVRISQRAFLNEVRRCRKRSVKGWTKEFREMTPEKVAEALIVHMKNWMLLEVQGDTLLLSPAIARWNGEFPEEFNGRERKIKL